MIKIYIIIFNRCNKIRFQGACVWFRPPEPTPEVQLLLLHWKKMAAAPTFFQ